MTYLRAVLTLLLSLTFAAAPLVTSPFTGFTANQLPIPQNDPPVQPAGYAFAIWGLIYAWLVISAVYGLWKRADDPDWNAARLPLIASLAVGTPWLAVANASAIWATVLILVMAATAIWAFLLAPARDRWWFLAPVGIYAGWLTAASAVSIGVTMAGYGLFFYPPGWAQICILAALAIAFVVWSRRRAGVTYPLTVIWALVGIVVANGSDTPSVTALAVLGAVLLAAAAWRGLSRG